jgi:hypothetical protein
MFRFRRSFGNAPESPAAAVPGGAAVCGVASVFVIELCLSAGWGKAGSQATGLSEPGVLSRSFGMDG